MAHRLIDYIRAANDSKVTLRFLDGEGQPLDVTVSAQNFVEITPLLHQAAVSMVQRASVGPIRAAGLRQAMPTFLPKEWRVENHAVQPSTGASARQRVSGSPREPEHADQR